MEARSLHQDYVTEKMYIEREENFARHKLRW